MSIEAAILGILTSNSALTAVVPAASFYSVNAPMAAANPCVIYQRSNTTATTTKQSEVWQLVTFEIDIFANNSDTVLSIGELVKTALNRYSGTYTGFDISNIRFDGQDSRDPDFETNTHHLAQGYIIDIKNT